jgi:hypothetical protein
MKKVICRGLLGAALTMLATFGIAGVSAASPSNPASMANPAAMAIPAELRLEPAGSTEASCRPAGATCSPGHRCCGVLACVSLGGPHGLCVAI